MKKSKAFCSICTTNYSAYATTLNESIKQVGYNDPHYVLIVDYQEKHKQIYKDSGYIAVPINRLHLSNLKTLIKKYNAFELCNVLKPHFMKWLLQHKKMDRLIYLDTDTYLFSKIDESLKTFDHEKNSSVLITPHIINPEIYEKKNDYFDEKIYFNFGLYNGGFYILKNDENTIRFLNWHIKKLEKFGYRANEAFMYVDQKILDFAPIIYKFFYIYHNNRYNIGHWNYEANQFTKVNDRFLVKNKPLVFFHFSQISDENNSLKFGYITVNKHTVLYELIDNYTKSLSKNNHQKISKLKYKYAKQYVKPSPELIEPNTFVLQQLQSCTNQLNSIKNSKGWKILNKIYQLKAKLLFLLN